MSRLQVLSAGIRNQESGIRNQESGISSSMAMSRLQVLSAGRQRTFMIREIVGSKGSARAEEQHNHLIHCMEAGQRCS